LGNQTVEVLVSGTLNAEVAAADIVDGFVVNHEAAVGVLEGGVCGEDRVVRLDNSGGVLRSRVDTELELGLLAVINRETFHQKSTETRASTTTERVEDEETLQTSAVVGDTANLVEDTVDHLLADSVVTTSIVVRGILLASNHLFGMEEAAVGTSADFVDNIGLQVTVDGTGNVFALAYLLRSILEFCGSMVTAHTSLGKESAETLVGVLGLAFFGQVTIRLNQWLVIFSHASTRISL
jgi:hypothetical protein